MNKYITVIALITGISGSTLAADTGTISFNGLVTDSTCSVDIGGSGANGTITLPTVSTAALQSATHVAGRTQFTMKLSGCTGALTSAKAFFEPGSTVSTATGRLINTNGTGAANVSLQLIDGTDNRVINVGDYSQVSSNSGFISTASGNASLPYFVEYYAESASVTAGAVTAQVTYSLTYK